MMARRLPICVCVLALVSAAPAWAQAGGAAAPESKVGARLFVHFEAQAMTAKDTFDAVMGTSTLKGFGGGGEVDGFWRGVFVRAALSRFKETGQRAFVFEGEVFPLGIPLEVKMTAIDIAAGWRFKPIGSPRIVPYLGGGAVLLNYIESSDIDEPGDEVNEDHRGFTLFGGIEVPVWRFVTLGGEVGWRKVALTAPGGIMGALGEKDLGGVSLRVMLSIRK